MMKKRWISKKLDVVREMPELYHRLPNERFELRKSEVVNWLLEQDDVVEWLFHFLQRTTKMIEYDKKTGKWHGVKEEGDE